MSQRMRERLQSAVDEHQYASLERPFLDDGDGLQGFVIASTGAWTLLATVTNMMLDGYVALRTEDIERIRRAGSRDLMVRWLKQHGPWPPPAPAGGAFPLTDPRSIIEHATQQYGLVSVFEEAMDTEKVFIGVPESYGKKSFHLREVSSGAAWASTTTKFRYADVTRIDFCDRYNTVLAAVAGPSPRGSDQSREVR